ncbi:PoNe immunity protein domain-containing protein [Pseudomonas sp. KnCO4]|uniref:PoNi-like cognate immunity protein n=1 Tax=Pseudomonas sp. KnCO4 TaxID=3381355 RepID=UPI003877FB91
MKKFDEIKREPLLQEAAFKDSLSFWKEFYFERQAESFLSIERPDYVNVEGLSWSWCFGSLQLLVGLYSGGEAIDSLRPYAEHMFSQFQRHKQAYPDFSLKLWESDAYQFALWLLSLAVLLNMPGRIEQVAGYISDNAEDGQDLLLRQLFARVGIALAGNDLINKRPYAELLNAINAQGDEQQQALRSYLKQWYRGMRNCYWHDRHRRRSDAGFFGYWAFEAGMVTVLWDVDDAPYRNLPYYPKDLVDYARERQVIQTFPRSLQTATYSDAIAKSGELCPRTGVWVCDDWVVGPQTFMQGVEMPADEGRILTWRLVKGL